MKIHLLDTQDAVEEIDDPGVPDRRLQHVRAGRSVGVWHAERVRHRARGRIQIRELIQDRRLLFAGCAVLCHFANAAMLPLPGEMLSAGKDHQAPLFMSACVMVTRRVVALIAPWVGRRADTWGRKHRGGV